MPLETHIQTSLSNIPNFTAQYWRHMYFRQRNMLLEHLKHIVKLHTHFQYVSVVCCLKSKVHVWSFASLVGSNLTESLVYCVWVVRVPEVKVIDSFTVTYTSVLSKHRVPADKLYELSFIFWYLTQLYDHKINRLSMEQSFIFIFLFYLSALVLWL